ALDGLGGGALGDPRAVATGTPSQVAVALSFRTGGPTTGLATLGNGVVRVYRADGAGGLSFVSENHVDPDTTGLSVADLDGDGNEDLLAGNTHGDVLVLYGDGRGGFAPYVNVDQRTFLAVVGPTAKGQPEFVFSSSGRDRVSLAV